MLSILIVDDETYVCDGIIQNIPWHELGIQSVHQAHTGREGLQLALQLKPDILLSDVRMPHMDGLAMASALQENGIQPQIIFMSAYSELSYYKKALKLHAVSFVEKPIILDELYAEIRHAVDRILSVQSSRLSEEELKAYGLNSLLQGGNVPAANAFRQQLAGYSYFTLCVASPLHGGSLESYSTIIRRLRQALPTHVYLAAALDGSRLVVLVAWPLAHSTNLSQLGKLLLTQCDSTPVFITGSVCSSPEQLPEAFHQALERQAYMFFAQESTFADSLPAMAEDTVIASFSHVTLRALQQAPCGPDGPQISSIMAQYINDLAKAGVSPDRARSESLNLLNLFRDRMLARGLSDFPAFSWNDVAHCSCADDLCAYCKLQIKKMSAALCDLQAKGRGAYSIMQEIQMGYCHSGFSIASLSEKLHFSESYLSNVFKKQYDTTIGTYINKLRMEKAKELLLQPGAKVSQVAAQVGFDDTDYFTKRFRQYTGLTPTEYRR